MNADQWLQCDLWLMTPFIADNASERKKRLLAVAFCRSIGKLYGKARTRESLEWAKRLYAFGEDPVPEKPNCLIEAVDAAEKFADGRIEASELEKHSIIADRMSFVEEYYHACYDDSWGKPDFKLFASSVAAAAIHYATSRSVDVEMVHKLAGRAVLRRSGSEENDFDKDEEQRQCALARDLFPNPDCRYEWPSEWTSPKAIKLASAIYEAGSFEDLPKLGKALKRAGCDDETVLSHCKSKEPHVRGCWVVDGVLGKS